MFKIETTRTRTSAWTMTEREVDAFRRWVHNPEMVRYISNGEVWSEQAIESFFTRQQGYIRSTGVCFGPVVEKSSGDIIGIGGIAPLELVPDVHLGWWIDPKVQGRGYATEVARSLVDYAIDVMKLARALAICHVDNVASQKVMRNAGMRFMEKVPGNSLESRWPSEENMVFGITREERINRVEN